MKTRVKACEADEWLKILLELKRKAVGVRFLFDKNDYENSSAAGRNGTVPYCTAVRNAKKRKNVLTL